MADLLAGIFVPLLFARVLNTSAAWYGLSQI